MNQWSLYQMGVDKPFLQGDLHQEVYMTLPQVGNQRESQVYRLLKSLYGLKQASRQWNSKFSQAMTKAGFSQYKCAYSFLIKKDGKNITLLLIYVDGVVITENNEYLLKKLKI